MNWGLYFAFFFFSMIKFMFAPFGGPAAGLNFFETYFSCVAGAIFCGVIFYFSADYFLTRAKKKKEAAYDLAVKEGRAIVRKKNFTKLNKGIVKLKRNIGKFGICYLTPLVCSVPVGSLICAKFYGKDKSTFPLIVLGIGINGFVTTGLAYLIQYFVK